MMDYRNVEQPQRYLNGISLLKETINTFRSNAISFYVINLICLSPAIIYLFFSISGAMSTNNTYLIISTYKLFQVCLAIIAQAAMVYGTVEHLAGRSVSIGNAISTGLRTIFLVIGVSITAALAIFGGVLLLIIPGIIIAMSFFVAVPVAVTEKYGVMASLRRSSALMYGSRLQVFGVIFIIFVIQAIFEQLALNIFSDSIYIYLSATVVINILFSSIQAVMAAVAYVRLREWRDQVDADELSKVFS